LRKMPDPGAQQQQLADGAAMGYGC
jgi:hypothetical protein